MNQKGFSSSFVILIVFSLLIVTLIYIAYSQTISKIPLQISQNSISPTPSLISSHDMASCLENTYGTTSDSTIPAITTQTVSFRPIENIPQGLTCLELIPNGKEYFALIQFSSPITDTMKKTITQDNIILYNYIPNFAFVAKFNSNSVNYQTFNDFRLLRWVGMVRPQMKTTSDVLKGNPKPNWVIDNSGNVTVNIRFYDNQTIENVTALLQSYGGNIVNGSMTAFRAKIPLNQIIPLTGENSIAYIEPYIISKISTQ